MATRTPQEKLKESLYRVNIAVSIPKEKKVFNIRDFRRKAEEVKKTFKRNESSIRFDPGF